MPQIAHPQFGIVNYAVLAAYLLAMLGVGIWAGRSTKGAAGYFIAEGKVHQVLVGLSLLGTYLSALTMMGLPALSYGKADWTWSIQLPFLLITATVITCFVLPRYRAAGVLSVYQFLEQRIHVSSRLLASVSFIILSIGRKGLVLYLPALAFSIVTGADLATTILVMGVIVTIYTVLGGIKGVIWTDSIQVVILVTGALATVYYIVQGCQGQLFAVAAAENKFRVMDMRFDITKTVTLWLVLQTLFETVRIYATQQDMTQRYMAAESTKKANWGVWMSVLGYIPLGYLFYFVGTGLFVYFKLHPDPAVPALDAAGRLDSLYAYFVVTHMPQGLAGLVMAAFFAASMSAISSNMNANSAVCVEDFYKRFWGKDKSDAHYLVVAKSLACVWGVCTIVAALLFMHIASAQIVWSKVMAVSTCGILGLMVLAFLPRRINPWAALVGFGAGYLSLFAMMFCLQIAPRVAFVYPLPKDSGVNFLLWPVVTNLLCFGVALVVDLLFPRKEKDVEPKIATPG